MQPARPAPSGGSGAPGARARRAEPPQATRPAARTAWPSSSTLPSRAAEAPVTRSALAWQAQPRGAEQPQPRQSRRPSARISRANFTEGMTAIVVGGVLLLVVAGTAAGVTQAGYRLDHAQHLLATARNGERRLEVQVASLQSPSRIAAIATTRLHMSQPSSFDTVQPLAVQNAPAPQPHTAVIPIAAVNPGPGSVGALWDALRTFVARVR